MPQTSHRRYVFTLQNYTPAQVELIRAAANSPHFIYVVFGREVAPTTGTPHLQGFFVLKNALTRSGALAHLGVQCHLEPARGTSVQAAQYCKKDGDFEEWGILPSQQGRRTDLEEVIEWIDAFGKENQRPPSAREIAEAQPTAFIRYRNVVELARHRCPVPILREGECRQWQQRLSDELDADPDDRTVVFYCDPIGGKGKTWFQQWYFSKAVDKVQLLGVGKRDDMAHSIDPVCRVFFINVPRGGMEYLQYTILEQLKDRMVYSPKYNSHMKALQTNCHVIVFCNEEPDRTKMSADRYVVRYLN